MKTQTNLETLEDKVVFKKNFYVFTKFFVGGAVLWLLICAFLGLYKASLIPLGYLIINLVLYGLSKKGLSFENRRFWVTILSIMLPFVFQWAAGGYQATGVVMIWSLMALLTSVTFYHRKETYFWLIIYLLFLVVSWIFEDDFSGSQMSVSGEKEIGSLLTLINLLSVSILLFSIASLVQKGFTKKIIELHWLNNQYSKILAEKEKSLQRYFNTQKEFFDANNELEKTKAELELSQAKLSSSLKAIDSTLYCLTLSKEGKIIEANDLFLQKTQFTLEELFQRDILSLFKGGEKNSIQDIFLGKERISEWSLKANNSEKIWIQATFSPVQNADGEVQHYMMLAQDVTDAKQIRQDFVSRYRALENFNPLAEIAFDGTILLANTLYANLLGYEPHELVRRQFYTLFFDKSPNEVNNLIRFVMLKGYQIGELVKVNKSGQKMWFTSNFSLVTNKKGEPIKIIEIAQDITGKKILEQNLETERKRIEKLNEITLSGYDLPQEQIVKLLDLCCSELNYETAVVGVRIDESDFLTLEYLNSASEEKIKPKSRIKTGKVKIGKSIQFSNFVFYNDISDLGECEFGDYIPKRMIFTEFDSLKGSVLFALLSHENAQAPSEADTNFLFLFLKWLNSAYNAITYQTELKKLSLVASKTNNAVIITDKEGLIEWVNEGFTSITGYKLEEVFGKKPGSFLQGELTDPKTVSQIRRGLQMQAPFYAELINYHKHGLPYWINLQITPIFNDKGILERFIAIQADITDRKNAEQRIKDAYGLLSQQSLELEQKSTALQIKNQQIQDSLRYAQRIQQAALGKEEDTREFFTDLMILYRPKEIVSGDFYWFAKVENKLIVAVIDCTGHGVPGAFMTMMAAAFLENIVSTQKITKPHLILENLNSFVVKTLKQSDTKNQDGMDIGLAVFHNDKKTVEYCGAKISLYMLRDREIEQIKSQRRHIGGLSVDLDFTTTTVEVHFPTLFYLFTDGYKDQFGGEPEKKFTLERLKQRLLSISSEPLNQQKEMLNQTIQDWIDTGNVKKQVDDILVLGMKFGS